MKTNEEIKKGLECCYSPVEPIQRCEACHYYGSIVCKMRLHTDALAYSQRLEAQNAELVKKAEYMEKVYVQMMKYLRGLCNACMHYGTPSNKAPCSHCKSARGFSEMWEWRGVQEQTKEAT